MFLSQLILLPVLIVFVWIYIRMRPRGDHGRHILVFDATVIGVAFLLSAWGLVWVAHTDVGHASPVWIPVLSAITTFHIVPIVLLAGWLIRRRWFRSSV